MCLNVLDHRSWGSEIISVQVAIYAERRDMKQKATKGQVKRECHVYFSCEKSTIATSAHIIFARGVRSLKVFSLNS